MKVLRARIRDVQEKSCTHVQKLQRSPMELTGCGYIVSKLTMYSITIDINPFVNPVTVLFRSKV